MAAQLEGRRRPTGKPMRVKIKRTPGTEANPAGALTRANRVDNRLALTTAVRVAVIVLHREAGQTVSEIAAYPQALVRAHEGMLSVVDRVAGVAVRLEPAARGVLPAWDRAVVVAGGGGRQIVNEEMHMNSIELNTLARKALVGLALVALTCAPALLCSSLVRSQTKPADSPQRQQTFSSPQEAADALIKAAETNDVPALKQIFGAAGEDLVESEDAVQDKNIAIAFAAEAHQKNSVTIDPKKPDRAVLVVGDNNWPMPIPIVKQNGKWLFDTKAGRQEMLYRRIGSNELDALQICRGFVEAQHEYALEKHDNSEVNQYAQRVISTPGKHDGLVWRNPDGSLGGPISERIADALQQGYTDKAKPYRGYFFKILKGQGPAAPLGEMNFVVEGAMIGGFALAAAPADYRVTGVKTFIVSYEGVVYQKDLGPDTLKIFKDMDLYNPDKSWQLTDDSWPADVVDASVSLAKE
jgi:Protein of unknown function (DUF2950)